MRREGGQKGEYVFIHTQSMSNNITVNQVKGEKLQIEQYRNFRMHTHVHTYVHLTIQNSATAHAGSEVPTH